jgi:hypothetical protein
MDRVVRGRETRGGLGRSGMGFALSGRRFIEPVVIVVEADGQEANGMSDPLASWFYAPILETSCRSPTKKSLAICARKAST